jgi:hypothetical protein
MVWFWRLGVGVEEEIWCGLGIADEVGVEKKMDAVASVLSKMGWFGCQYMTFDAGSYSHALFGQHGLVFGILSGKSTRYGMLTTNDSRPL